ncbi:MAG: hypothetical protein ACXWE7_12750, partial [Nitrososphaeraceae archaeon]
MKTKKRKITSEHTITYVQSLFMIRDMMNGPAISIGIIIGNKVVILFIIELKGLRLLHLCKYFRYLYQSQKEL